MVTQGQGLSKRDFAEDPRGRPAGRRADQPEALRLDRPHVRRARASSCARRAIQRVHHNVESSRSYYPEVSTTVRYEGRLRTIEAVKEAGLETCVGGILNLGETPRQRVEMAFELSELNPTSVPINLLNPREGTKFGERPLMDALGGRQVGRDLPPDHPRGAVPPLRRAGREPRRPAAAGRQGRPERGDDGQLPHHPRRRAGGRPGDVRGARAERGAPARQRRQPTARQPLGLARGRDAGDADGRVDRPPGRGELLGPVHPAPGDQEGEETASLPAGAA